MAQTILAELTRSQVFVSTPTASRQDPPTHFRCPQESMWTTAHRRSRC